MMAPRVGKTDKYTRSTDHPLFPLDRPTDRAPTANGEGNSFPPGRKIVATVASATGVFNPWDVFGSETVPTTGLAGLDANLEPSWRCTPM